MKGSGTRLNIESYDMKMKVPKLYGIIRIDVDKKRGSVHAYRVKIRKRNKDFIKYFGDATYGGKRKAFENAKAYRDKIISTYRPFSRAELSNVGASKSKSGIVGVTLVEKIEKRNKTKHKYLFWKAWWSPKVGVRKTVSFSVNKHGYKKAFELAKKAREKGLKQMKDLDKSFIKISMKRKSR